MTATAIAAPPLHLPTPTPAAVVFDGVTKHYGAAIALDGISLALPIGATVALLGPNGAGKSTAINLMLNLLHADSGEIRVLGLSPADAIASGRVGAMLQEGALPVGVTVAELIGFARSLYPHPFTLAEALSTSGLTSLADRRTEGLSGGETQRLRFALAIAGDPDLLFLDEPTVAMDVESRRAFWADMRRLAEQGRSILFATHYLEEADQVADRIVVLDHGRVVADGTPASIKAAVAGRTVRFTLENAQRYTLLTLPGVSDVAINGSDVRLTTDDADATVHAIYRGDLPIRHLEVTGADLEDAFVALTSGR